MRLFIAAEIPAPIIHRLGALIEHLRGEIAGPRWVKPEGIHLTFKFLGEVNEQDLPRLSGALGAAMKPMMSSATPPLVVSLAGIGTFPERGRAKVLWVGLREPTGGLETTHRRVEQAVQSAALVPVRGRERVFSPHLTLARFGEGPTPAGLAHAIATCNEALEPSGESFEVASVCLFQSLLKPGGAEYRKLEEYPL